jgi:hypothetical protein
MPATVAVLVCPRIISTDVPAFMCNAITLIPSTAHHGILATGGDLPCWPR